MRRRLLAIAAAVSLLLCGVTVALWVRSGGAGDCVGCWTSKTQAVQHGDYREETSLFTSFWGLQSRNGRMGVGFARSTMFKTTPAIFATQWSSVPDAQREFRWTTLAVQTQPFQYECRNVPVRLGFLVAKSAGPGTDRKMIVQAPHWALVLVTGAIPVIHLLSVVRRRPKGGVHCPTCGYDLCVTPDRCPECGTIPQARSAAAA